MRKVAYQQLRLLEPRHWWFVGMRAIIQRLLSSFGARGLILDIGCGTGGNLKLLSLFGVPVGLDNYRFALLSPLCRSHPLVQADAQSLPFKDNSFNLVISLDVLYHQWIADPAAVVNESVRVLKKGGLLIIRTPAFQWLYRGHDWQVMTARRFNAAELASIMPAKLKILKVSYVNMFLLPLLILSKNFSSLSNLRRLPPSINKLLTLVLKLEAWLITKVNLPFGSSVILVARSS